nr:AMP-binding protein [Actinomycetota bacterium]
MSGDTLVDVLLGAVERTPEQVLVQVDSAGAETVRTYRQLCDEALRIAGGLRQAGLAEGMPVLILPTGGTDFVPAFWGAVLAGAVPVPVPPQLDRVGAVQAHLGDAPIVVAASQATLARTLVSGNDPGKARVLTMEQLRHADPMPPHRPKPEDLALLQFSSGSTSRPKGVRLSHANLVANLRQARSAGAASASDVVVSWLPYFHDMGLIGAHLTALSTGAKQVTMEPAVFAKRPALWLQVAARHRATVLPIASFALALTCQRVSAEQVAALDLSRVRMIGVGAEPIPVPAWREFARHLQPAGLDPRAMTPLYGLAEATVAVAFGPVGQVARTLRLDRSALADGRAVDADPDSPPGAAVELLELGPAVPEGELRVVDDDGSALGDSFVGQVEFRGPNVAQGYDGLPAQTSATFVDGWLRTGDLGFLRQGRLCVTGRAKDVLYVNGQKHHAHDVEQVVAATPGVPSGPVAVVGSTTEQGTERVTVFVTAPRPAAAAAAVDVMAEVRARVREALGHDDVSVVPIPARRFPRTTSGKIRRAALRADVVAGDFDALTVAPAPSPTPGHAPRSRTEIEAIVTAIWARVLDIPATQIQPADRFLAIGGTSLSAMQLLAHLEDEFGGPLEPAVLRECGTVSALADHLIARSRTGAAPARTVRPASTTQPAGVIGMACRFPDADTPEAFWRNLVQGRDSVTEVPAARWRVPEGARARWGAFLDDVAGFDADWFGMGDDEAAMTDPHARIFLEVAHEALERAGYAGPRRRGRRIGVFVAVGESGYAELLHQAMTDGVPLPPSALVGNLRNLIAARVAHCLDLSGPALTVDTACSSSLVALHLARRSLEAGECDLAVVGGVSLNLTPTAYRLLESAQALSPTGRSRAFAAGADGFVPGEGAAAIVLEPLDRATDHGDRVLALVRGSAVNNDGRSLSLMAPNPVLQAAVIDDAYRDAGIDPASVGYVEAHGTGTAVGDPIEARSLVHAFPRGPDGTPRWVGSVKTNLGHLLNAAGMPSLVKVILALQHRELPASLHHDRPSGELDLAAGGLEVITEHRSWQGPRPLRAGINGFGFGGTNAHVILQEAPPPAPPTVPAAAAPHLLTLSAGSEEALRAAATDLAAQARAHPEIDEGDLCHSASTARDDAPHRLALVADGDLAAALEARIETHMRSGEAPARAARRRPRVALVFAGQGTQLLGLGCRLHATEPAYRRMLEHLSDAAGPVEGRTLVQWSLDPGMEQEQEQPLSTAVTQPLLVAVGISLAEQLRAWGVRPDAVLGHSVGELAAAAVCGALTPPEAVRLAARRGALMQERCAAGGMAAVLGPETDVREVVEAEEGRLAVAAVNGPEHLVISGETDALERGVAELTRRGCRCRRLALSRAFHSAMVDPALPGLREAATDLTPCASHVPLLSSVTGAWSPALDPAYLVEHARRPVLFGPAVQRLLQDGYDTFVEIGPGSTLTGLVRSITRSHDADDVLALACLGDGARGDVSLLRTLGRLWERGVPLGRPDDDGTRPRVDVPTYPFQRRRHWLPDPPGGRHVAADARRLSPLLHRVTWSQVPHPAGQVLRSVCLVGGDDGVGPVLHGLISRLARRGVPTHRATPGRLDERPDASVLVLLADLDEDTSDAVGAALEVARHLAQRPTPLLVVTHDVLVTGIGSERPRPDQAVLAGLLSALPQEQPGQTVRVVDLSSLDDAAERVEC